jgi:hypothetical protein
MALGNKVQFLADSPERVREEIAAKGGTALPIPPIREPGNRRKGDGKIVRIVDGNLGYRLAPNNLHLPRFATGAVEMQAAGSCWSRLLCCSV